MIKDVKEITEAELALARIIANLAVDASNGDKEEAAGLLRHIAAFEPHLEILMAKTGYLVVSSTKSTHQ